MENVSGQGTITIYYLDGKKKKKKAYEIGFGEYKGLEYIIKETIESFDNITTLKLKIDIG